MKIFIFYEHFIPYYHSIDKIDFQVISWKNYSYNTVISYYSGSSHEQI